MDVRIEAVDHFLLCFEPTPLELMCRQRHVVECQPVDKNHSVGAFGCEAHHRGHEFVVVGLVLDELIDSVVKFLVIAAIDVKLASYAAIGQLIDYVRGRLEKLTGSFFIVSFLTLKILCLDVTIRDKLRVFFIGDVK